jgi:hypothetical protein
VAPATYGVREFTESWYIVSGIKRDPVVERESFAGVDAFRYLVKFFVV